jgi:hypothetical protein
MQLLKDLTKGLKTVEPFLNEYGFKFDNYENDNSRDMNYTIATYTNEQKIIHFDYRFSYGQVLYQFKNSIVSHPFYLDELGYADKIKHKEFLMTNKLEAFNHILHDFDFLVEDFFAGECAKLKEIAKLQDSIITGLDKELRKQNTIRLDNIRIDKARQVFRLKDFNKAMLIYNAVENKNLLVEVDNKIIEYCKRHI